MKLARAGSPRRGGSSGRHLHAGVYWLRYNPNAYHVDGDLVRVPKAGREKRLLGWLSGFESPGPLGIGYAFCDEEDGMLSVLDNASYSPHCAAVVVNLGQMLDT